MQEQPLEFEVKFHLHKRESNWKLTLFSESKEKQFPKHWSMCGILMANCPGNLPLLRFPLGKFRHLRAKRPSSLNRQSNFCYATLGVVASSGNPSPWPSCPAPGDQPGAQGPRLRDAAAAFPFAGSTSSKAELGSQRHTHRTGTWPVTQTATQKVLPSTVSTYRTRLKHKHRQPNPLLLLGWQRQKVTSAGTQTTLQYHCLDPRPSCLPHGSPTPCLVQGSAC